MRLILTIAAAIVFAGCDTPPIITSEAMRKVEIDGQTVFVAPMKHKDSWGATRYTVGPLLSPNPIVETALLSAAIEKATGCKVVSAHYRREDGANLYAMVSCAK